VADILILNLPGKVLKAGSRWYNVDKTSNFTIRYYPYPWMMAYATALLKKHGFSVVFKDALALRWDFKKTVEYVRALKPKYIVCEPTWASKEEDRKLLDVLGENIVKIAVGNYATNYPFECLEKINVDYVVVGEYEFSLLEFFKSNGKILPKNFVSRTKKEYEMPDLVPLDLFPWPERDDTPIYCYNEPSSYGKNVVMVSSRGCRLKCSFCNVEAIYGRHMYRTRNAKDVVDEMEYILKKYHPDEIYFDDDNMVSNEEHVKAICNEIIRRGLKVRWLCMGDGLVDDETLELLAKAGCVTYKFGLEHLDEDVLKAIPKPLKKERSLQIIKKCKELGMKSYTCLMVGLPNSTFEKDLKMIKEVIKADPDLIQISITTPYPGTALYKRAKENGWLVSDDPSYFDATGKSALSYPNYPAEKIEEMYRLGWKLWYRHVLFHKPKTLWFIFTSEVKRSGLIAASAKAVIYVLKALLG
jgi:radical SAM superfamily enzyme YgiQ (UPF0313 family)